MIIAPTTRPNGTLVLAFRGRCDFTSRHTYQSAIVAAMAQCPKRIIFDFSELSYIDSAGLGLITLTHKQYPDRTIPIVIAAPSPPIKEILDIAHIAPLFPVFSTVDSAATSVDL